MRTILGMRDPVHPGEVADHNGHVYCTLRRAAEIAGCSVSTVHRRIDEGTLTEVADPELLVQLAGRVGPPVKRLIALSDAESIQTRNQASSVRRRSNAEVDIATMSAPHSTAAAQAGGDTTSLGDGPLRSELLAVREELSKLRYAFHVELLKADSADEELRHAREQLRLAREQLRQLLVHGSVADAV